MNDNKRLIIVSPGWGNSALHLRALQNKFKSEGFDFLIVPNTGVSIEDSANKLAQVIERIHRYYSHISLLGYSMGGLVGRYLIYTLPEVAYIKSYISIATPHGGCYLAELAPWSRTAGEMKPSSKLIHFFKTAKWPLQIPALTLIGGFDELIRPLTSGTFVPAENIIIPHAAHLSVIMSQRTFYEIYSWLCSIFFLGDFQTKNSNDGIGSKLQL